MIGSAHNRAFLWLIGLLAFHLLLLSLQVRTPDGRLLVRSVGLTLLTPLASSLHHVGASIGDYLDRYALLRDVEQQNRRLRKEIRDLRLDLYRFRELAALLPRSADYEALRERRDFETLLADVIGKSYPLLEHHILIDLGSRHGVRQNSAVLSPEGIVGRVVSVGPLSAEVELITNNLAAAGARLANTRAEGVVFGSGEPLLLLDYIPISQPAAVGELVFTSGTDQIYPRGLPIGYVEDVQRGGLVYQIIHVRPTVDWGLLEQVLVVVNPTPADRPRPDGDLPADTPPSGQTSAGDPETGAE